MALDQTRFPLASNDTISQINNTTASKNTARATKTWLGKMVLIMY